jgi:nucleoid DNA-binding protein
MDQTLLDLYKDTAKKNDVSPELVETVIKYVFSDVASAISNHTNDEILLHGFVRFKIPMHSTKRYLEQVELSYKRGFINEKKYIKTKERLNSILDGKKE